MSVSLLSLKNGGKRFACHYCSWTKTGLGLPPGPKSLADRFPLGFGNTFCAKFSFGSKFWSGPFGNLVAVSGSKHFFLWDTSCLGLLTLPIEQSGTGSCLNSSHTTARKKMVIFGEDYGRGQEVLREESRIVKFVFLLEMGLLGSQASTDKNLQFSWSILLLRMNSSCFHGQIKRKK